MCVSCLELSSRLFANEAFTNLMSLTIFSTILQCLHRYFFKLASKHAQQICPLEFQHAGLSQKTTVLSRKILTCDIFWPLSLGLFSSRASDRLLLTHFSFLSQHLSPDSSFGIEEKQGDVGRGQLRVYILL